MNTPLRFHPYLRPMVWGGRRLGEALGKPLPTADAYGESWEISDHASHRSTIIGGPSEPTLDLPGSGPACRTGSASTGAGRTLRDLMEHERADLLGPSAPSYDTFPWLVKLLDAWDWLSVQVHPDEESVKRLWPGEGSKTEAWFVLDAAPGSKIYAGLMPGVGKRELRAALAAGTVAECLHQFEPRPGDCLFLPAGTVHAVGGGVLMAEVQQTSDATFRLFDWNRRDAKGQSRKLHVEESIACIHWQDGPVRPVHAADYGSAEAGPLSQPLVLCRYFALEYVRQWEPFWCGGVGRMQTVVVLHGAARLETAEGEQEVRAGDTLLFPATMPRLRCQPRASLGLLVATLPHLKTSDHE
jgi:mannose-6-phosphate isomerase